MCSLDPETGDGNLKINQFYYDNTKKTCLPFIYNGIGGNDNKFDNIFQCLAVCTGETTLIADKTVEFEDATSEIINEKILKNENVDELIEKISNPDHKKDSNLDQEKPQKESQDDLQESDSSKPSSSESSKSSDSNDEENDGELTDDTDVDSLSHD